MTATLNRDGRPWGVPRMHTNRRGVAKPELTEEAAAAKALELNIERAQRGLRRRGLVEAYACWWCDAWHFGTPGRARRRRTQDPLWAEVGQRAFWNLTVENIGTERRRLDVLRQRARRRGREAIPSRP